MAERQPVEIRVEDVSKRFAARTGEVQVLQNVSLSVHPSEFLSVVGPSGCGKTTLLRIVAGLVPADGGRVLVGGEEVTAPDARASVVFQQGGLLPWRTVRANVALGLGLMHHRRLTAEESDRVEHYLRLVGLHDFQNYFPGQLSGGMQQRVGLARALARQPQVLLMDEPFGALDAQTKALLQDELQHLWEAERITVLFITHDIDEAIYLSDRVALMSRRPGRLKSFLNVEYPRPRYEHDPRQDATFGAMRAQAWSSLREELATAL